MQQAMDEKEKFLDIVKSNQRLMSILAVAREVSLPNWYVGGGVVRNAVWDYFHGYFGENKRTPIRDVDLVHYSKSRLAEEEILDKLQTLLPGIRWDLKNSAYLHEWYKRKFDMDIKPLNSVEEDIECWPETATCAGLRLLPDDKIIVFAPWGLDDLMNMMLRRNTHKTRNVTEELFERRVKDKKILERWPKVKVIHD